MKKSAGFFITILSVIATVISAAAYLINAQTAYFVNLGISPAILGCFIVAIVIQFAYIVMTGHGHHIWNDLLAVFPPVLMIVAVVSLIGSRIVGIASIMTFETTAQNMADLTSAIVSIAGCVVATILGVLAAFFDTVKG